MTKREQRVEAIWKAYPKKLDKQIGIQAVRRALAQVDYEVLLKAVEEFNRLVTPYKKDAEKWLLVPYPQKWFNRNRWEPEAMVEARMRFPGPKKFYFGTVTPRPGCYATHPWDAVEEWIEAGKTPEEAKRLAVKVYR